MTTPGPTTVAPTSGAAAPRTAGQLELQQQVKTSKTLPDALIVAVFTGGLALMILGIALGDIEEVTIAGLKLKFSLASEVAAATLEKAQSEGEVTGQMVPVEVLEALVQRAAINAVGADQLLDHGVQRLNPRPGLLMRPRSHGVVPQGVLRQVAREYVKDATDPPTEQQAE